MKKVLLSVLVFSIFLVSCVKNDTNSILKKLDKTLDNYIGYEAKAELQFNMDKGETVYLLDEMYRQNGEIKLSILEPSENKGITIEYKDDKIFLNNASIRQSISLKGIKGLNRSLLFGEVFESRELIDSVREEESEEGKYYVISYTLRDNNRYNKEKIIYLDKKDFKPYKMIILDGENNPRISIEYKDFNYIENKEKWGGEYGRFKFI